MPLFKNLNLMVAVSERIAIIGPNGIGKSTLLRTLVGDLTPDTGTVKWSENAEVGYFAQDHAEDLPRICHSSNGWGNGEKRPMTIRLSAAPWEDYCSAVMKSTSP